MMNENALEGTIREMILKVLEEEVKGRVAESPAAGGKTAAQATISDDGFVDDVTVQTIQEQFFVPEPYDREGYLKMKQSTPGRLGIWRTGTRHITKSTLRFWADHAAAQNAVWSDVDPAVVEGLGCIALRSKAEDKAEYLKNPNTGRCLNEESAEIVKRQGQKKVNVQIVFADGLSSRAIEKNAADILPALNQSLDALGLSHGTPFFVTNGRVASGDEIGQILDCDVLVMLVGERPGLNSTASMGAYVCYKPTVGMEESRRTVISNIHALGTVPVEAGAQIAELCQSMIKHKMSGVDLKLVEN